MCATRRERVLKTWRVLFATASLVVLATPSFAQAPLPPGIAVEWSAPSGCPDENSVRASIAVLLGQAAIKKTGEGLSFRALVVPKAGRFALDVHIRSASGEEAKSLE